MLLTILERKRWHSVGSAAALWCIHSLMEWQAEQITTSPLSWWSSVLRRLRSIPSSGSLCKNSLHNPLNMTENTIIKSVKIPIEVIKQLLLMCSFPVLSFTWFFCRFEKPDNLLILTGNAGIFFDQLSINCQETNMVMNINCMAACSNKRIASRFRHFLLFLDLCHT